MKKKRNKCIGVFDSGFGGISTLRSIVKMLPEYDYIYLGDTARTPYGTRSPEIVYEFTKQAVDFLFKNGCEFVILACNTASSESLRRLQKEYMPKKYPGKKVLGVLIPAIEEAAVKTKNRRIGVMATEGTVRSKSFVKEAAKRNGLLKIYQESCPLLVPLVESGEQNSKAAGLIVKKYVGNLKKKKIDTLILGCTHYGILKNKIKKITGRNISIVSDSDVVPKQLKQYLIRHPDIEAKIRKNRKVLFYSTDVTERFKTLGSKFFGKPIRVKKISLP